MSDTTGSGFTTLLKKCLFFPVCVNNCVVRFYLEEKAAFGELKLLGGHVLPVLPLGSARAENVVQTEL